MTGEVGPARVFNLLENLDVEADDPDVGFPFRVLWTDPEDEHELGPITREIEADAIKRVENATEITWKWEEHPR